MINWINQKIGPCYQLSYKYCFEKQSSMKRNIHFSSIILIYNDLYYLTNYAARMLFSINSISKPLLYGLVLGSAIDIVAGSGNVSISKAKLLADTNIEYLMFRRNFQGIS
jgi:uncharacterized membrane protein SpoIIM required for sporulation